MSEATDLTTAERISQCSHAIMDLLDQYHCTMSIMLDDDDEELNWQIVVMPKEQSDEQTELVH